MAQSPRNFSSTLIVLAVVAVLAVGAAAYLNKPDQRTLGERVDDATHELSKGNIGDAGRALEKRTPGEKLGDAVKDAGDDIKHNTNN